jgi:amino acid transporter
MSRGEDERLLAELGYKQELSRRLSGFSNYAISFSIICILAGGITSFHIALDSAGGAGVALGWPAACLFSLVVAAAMAQIASAFPTAGGLYHWGSLLGGRGWGWATAWFNLAGLVTALAAINAGAFDFAVSSLGIDPGAGVKPAAVLVLVFVQGWLNHRGIHLTARLTDFSGWWILIVAVVLTAALLASTPHWEWARLWRFENFTGKPASSPTFPRSGSIAWAFCLALMFPAYTLTGFDASAHTAEETHNAARSAPAGILRSVIVSGLAGWAMVAALLLALPDVPEGVAKGSDVTPWAIRARLPGALGVVMLGAIAIGQLFCGLAALTSASRMLFAFARDGGLPFSNWLRRVDPVTGGPGAAVWAVAVAAAFFTIATPYNTIAAASTVLIYVSYVMPVAAGAVAWGGRWTRVGPWHAGRWYRPLAVVATVGCAFLVVLGIQPPSQQVAPILIGAVVLMFVLWFAVERRRFKGPPEISIAVHPPNQT